MENHLIGIQEVREQHCEVVHQSQELTNHIEVPQNVSADIENQQILRETILNDDVAVEMLHESRQIVHVMSKEEVMLMVLENRNMQANHIKQYNNEVRTDYENVLAHELQPNISAEYQHYSQIQIQMKNTETLLNKLKAVILDIETKHSDLKKEMKIAQRKHDTREAALKALLNKKKNILSENNKKFKLLRDREFGIGGLLEIVMKLEDSLALAFNKKSSKNDRNNMLKTDLNTFNEHLKAQTREINELNANICKHISELNLLKVELNSLKDGNQNVIEKFEMREAVLTRDNLKARHEAMLFKLNDLNELICKKQDIAMESSVLQEECSKLEKEKEILLSMCNAETESKTEEVEEILLSLQKEMQEIHHNITQTLEHEKILLIANNDLTCLEYNYQTSKNQQNEEQMVLNGFLHNISDCNAKLIEQKQQFEEEVAKLLHCLNEHNIDYEKDSEYKNIITRKQESTKEEYEQQFKLKLAEIEKKKAENLEFKEELEKSLEAVEVKSRLKEKLEKENASLLSEYNAKYSNIYGLSSTLCENVKGILKSPRPPPGSSKKVTFQGLSSELSSCDSNPSSQIKPVEPNQQLNALLAIIRQLPNRQTENKKRKSLSDSSK